MAEIPSALLEPGLAHLAPADRALLEEFLATQQAILDAARRGEIDQYHPQAHQLPFHLSPCSNRWFVGANKTGKTYACYAEVRWFALGEHPYRDVGQTGLIWCCCPTEELSLMYQQPQVIAAIGQHNIKEYRRGAHPMLVLKNGVVILFKYYAQGAKVFPSAGVRLIMFDEEPPWEVFEECWVRRSAGHSLDIIGANTMVKGLTWIYDKIIKKQLPDTDWFTAKLDDNLFIASSEREKVKAGLKSSPAMYKIRVEGEILPIGGVMRFDANVLATMFRTGVQEPRARFDFDFENERWVQTEHGRLSVYDMPADGYEYVVGVDVAEGLNTSYSDNDPVWDDSSCQVLNRSTRRFVADYTAGDIEPAQLGEHIVPRLSRFFNRAWVNIELNNHGHTVAAFARRKVPTRLWSPVRDRAEKGPRTVRRLGSLVTKPTRTFLIDTLAEALRQESVEIPSGETLQQFMSFVVKSSGRVEHQDGAKDDRVFACGHAMVCDKDLPPAKIVRPPSVKEQLRQLATANPGRERRIQWFRKIARAA